MTVMVGADVESLRHLAGDARAAARSLEGVARTLGPVIARGAWQGPDADRFRHQWAGQHAPSLAETSRVLAEAADALGHHADEQAQASDHGGIASGALALATLASAAEWVSAVKKPVLGALTLKKVTDLMRIHTAADALAEVNTAAASARVFVMGDMVDTALGRNGFLANQLARLGGPLGAVGRWLGPIGGLFAIAGGTKELIDPTHDGWRGTGDRIAGALSIAGGAATIALAFGAGAALAPVAATALVAVAVGAGVVAGAWSLGNLVYDHRQDIGAFLHDAGRRAGDAAAAVGSGVSDAATRVAAWAKGLFS
ncbi:WXG100 family type VII secretion target [Propioniciclava soli]|uniref:WXG100 family type VII secretion target n=1 Tax=Propioniciclava soli TaxID=2775081 RepID=UPI001E3EA428|nr:hypothetical protein [Propioniciclava soli]